MSEAAAAERLAAWRHCNTPLIIASGMFVGTAASLILGLQPILLGGLTEAGRLSEAGLGVAATVEILGLALGATVGPRLMNGGSLRLSTAVVCMLLAVANLGIYWVKGPIGIYAVRGTAGLLEGLALGAAILVLTHTRHPDRVAGLFLGVQTIPQIIGAYLLPVFVVPRLGINAGFGLLALVALVAVGGALGSPDHVDAADIAPARKVAWSSAIRLFIATVVTQNAGIGAAWNYLERLAPQNGFTASSIGLAVAGSLVSQVVGAFVVAWFGWRAPYRATLILGAFAQAGVALLLMSADAPISYIAAACVFGLLWLALPPFQVQQAIVLDPTRRLAMLLTPLALLGLSIGPFLVSFAVRPDDVSGAFWGAAALGVTSAIGYILLLAFARSAIRLRFPSHRDVQVGGRFPDGH